MLGSEHNDEFYMDGGEVRTRTNRCCPSKAPLLLMADPSPVIKHEGKQGFVNIFEASQRMVAGQD